MSNSAQRWHESSCRVERHQCFSILPEIHMQSVTLVWEIENLAPAVCLCWSTHVPHELQSKMKKAKKKQKSCIAILGIFLFYVFSLKWSVAASSPWPGWWISPLRSHHKKWWRKVSAGSGPPSRLGGCPPSSLAAGSAPVSPAGPALPWRPQLQTHNHMISECTRTRLWWEVVTSWEAPLTGEGAHHFALQFFGYGVTELGGDISCYILG